MPRIAVLQMTSGIDPKANYNAILEGMGHAEAEGAEVLFTPEMALMLDRNRKRASEWIDSPAPDELLNQAIMLMEMSDIDLAIGSMPIRTSSGKWANRSVYISAKDERATTYDKMHMFDVRLKSGETWHESAAYEPGRQVVTVENTPVERLGLTVCYDLRFPALFDALGNQWCDTIAVPAAFTQPTGAAHWHVMLRARAIEASAFVVAAAQVGEHEDGRRTYGHSLVVDPWGEVLLDMGGEKPGVGIVDIDLDRISEVRAQVPSLANRRPIAT